MTPARRPSLLLCVAASGLVGCAPAPEHPWGYAFSPDESGSVTFVAADGTTETYPIDAECWLGSWETLMGDPPQFNVAAGPAVNCSSADFPAIYLFEYPDRATTLDWPASEQPLMGGRRYGDDLLPVEIEVTTELFEGTLLNPPPENEPPPTWSDPATTSDYARRFRLHAEFTCAEVNLECDGTWIYDATLELSAESVTWIYPPAE